MTVIETDTLDIWKQKDFFGMLMYLSLSRLSWHVETLDWEQEVIVWTCQYKSFEATKTCQDLPRSVKTYQDLLRLTKTQQDLLRPAETYQDLPRLTKTCQDLPIPFKLLWPDNLGETSGLDSQQNCRDSWLRLSRVSVETKRLC